MIAMPISASNARLNLLWQDIISGHYNILSFATSSLQDDSLQFPESFFEQVIDEIHRQWQKAYTKFDDEQAAISLARRQDFPLNLHKRFFDERKDKFDYLVLLSSHHTTTEQLEILIDEFTSLGEFEKREKHSGYKDVFKNVIFERFDVNLTKKYLDHPYIPDYEEYHLKAIEFFDEKELVNAIEKHPGWFQSIDFLESLAKKALSSESSKRILEYARFINGGYNDTLFCNDFVELSLLRDEEEINRILNKRLNKNALMIAANNPFARKEILEDNAKKICEKILHDEEHYNLIKDILNRVPIHETVCELIMANLDKVDEWNEEQYYESLFEITYELFETAPLDAAISLAKKWADTFYAFEDRQLSSPYLMRRGVEDEELWKIFLREDVTILPQGKSWIDFWRSIPDKFFSLVPVRELGMEPLLGIYSREDISDEFRQELFDELLRRGNSDVLLLDKWNRAFNEYDILVFNEKLPYNQAKWLKTFVLDHMESNMMFSPSIYFSQSDLIKKLVELKESNKADKKELLMNIIERSNLSNQIKSLFDEPPQWGGSLQKKGLYSSMS